MTRPTLARVRAWPWYPAFLAAAYVLVVFGTYPLPVESAVRPLLVSVSVALIATLAWGRLLGAERGGLAGAITFMGLVAAGDASRVLAIVLALFLLVVEWQAARRGRLRIRIPWAAITRALNIFLAVLLVIQVVQVIRGQASYDVAALPEGWQIPAGADRPSIYLVLADGHGRRDVLAERYGYSSEQLADRLEAMGFVESPASWANQTRTNISLSSMLNGRPLSELGQDMAGPFDEQVTFSALADPALYRMLANAGYETTVISSGYDHLMQRRVDHYVEVGPVSEVEETILRATAVGQLLWRVTGARTSAPYTRVVDELAALRAEADRPSTRPKLVLAHLPVPHWPIVLTPDCKERPEDASTGGTLERGGRPMDAAGLEAYRGQVACTGTLLAETLQSIVTSDPEAVVVLFSDHGPEELMDWNNPDPLGIRDRLANVFWARTPGRTDVFPESLTLVNVVPLLSNAYFGTSIPLNPDDRWLEPTGGDPSFRLFSDPEP